MSKVVEYILLGAIPGLMFMIIPVPGMEARFSWQLISLWLAGVAFSSFLSSWWRRGFFLLALVRTAILPPDIESYIMLLIIAVFLGAVEGFKRIDEEKMLKAFVIAAILLIYWTAAQKLGITQPYFGGRSVGPFNPDEGGVFLALCLPVAFRPRWRLLIPCILWGIYVSETSTGFLAALMAAGVFAFYLFREHKKKLLLIFVVLTLIAGSWFLKVDPIQNTRSDPRWIAWKHAAWSMRSELWGRGLGSWEKIFPLLASGDKRIGLVDPAAKGVIMKNVFIQAHNEYIQMAFELGVHVFIFLILFSVFTFIAMIRGAASPYAAAGMTALIVSCLGFFTLHIAPTSLLGMAWIGIWERTNVRGQEHKKKERQNVIQAIEPQL
jgi:O-antigen ligase